MIDARARAAEEREENERDGKETERGGKEEEQNDRRSRPIWSDPLEQEICCLQNSCGQHRSC